MLVVTAAIVGEEVEFTADLIFFEFQVNFFGLSLIMAILFGAALLVLLPLAFSQRWRDVVEGLIHRITPERFRPSLEGLAQSFFKGLESLRSPADMGIAWVLSCVSWLLEATMYYIVGLAFDIDVGFQYYVLACAAANLAISVLASQGGIGPFEFVTKQIFIAAGVTSSLATAYAIGLHALVLLPVTVLGLYFIGTMGFSLGEMFRRSTADAVVVPDAVPPGLPREGAQGP
jgi:uncharacterized membrane protein YbhN (UPF0104 family)